MLNSPMATKNPIPTRPAALGEIILYPALLTPFLLTVPMMLSVLLKGNWHDELEVNPFEVVLLHIGGTLLGLILQASVGIIAHKILRKYHAPIYVYAVTGALICFFGWMAITGVWIDPFAWWLAGFGFIQAGLTHYFAIRKYRLNGLAAIPPYSN